MIGVDGGGSRCRARLSDIDGRDLGEGSAGPANTRLGLESTFAAIGAACEQALRQAGLPASELSRLHAGLGLAGLNLTAERTRLKAYPHPFASMVAASDGYVACLGAHGGADGGVVILGTGSCGCVVRGGRCCHVGGWGFRLGDQGGGAQLGLQALRQALLAHENQRPQTLFGRHLLSRFGDNPEHVLQWADTATPGDYAALAPAVFRYAEQGDPLARELVAAAATGAARLIAAVRGHGAPRIALLGGLAAPLLPYLSEAVRTVLTEPVGDALSGALLMIRRQLARDRR